MTRSMRLLTLRPSPASTARGALVARRTNQALDVGLHQDLQHSLGDGARRTSPSRDFCIDNRERQR
jgi:hypothetical protein